MPSALNSKVNHNNYNNMNNNNNCACTVVSHSRGFARFDLTFCPLSTAVQWSTRADFNNVVGERELLDWISYHGTMGAQCHIAGLTQGRRYFLRAACGNVKGWGSYRNSVPASVVPSSEYSQKKKKKWSIYSLNREDYLNLRYKIKLMAIIFKI